MDDMYTTIIGAIVVSYLLSCILHTRGKVDASVMGHTIMSVSKVEYDSSETGV